MTPLSHRRVGEQRSQSRHRRDCSDHDHTNASATELSAGASEADECIEKLVAAVDKCRGISDHDKTAVAFAIRCAYGMGYEEGRCSLRAAA